MQQLFEFLRRWNHVFIFVVLEAVGSLLLFRFNHYQGNVYLTAANGVTSSVDNWYFKTTAFFQLKQNNQELTHENIRLTQENATLQHTIALLRKQGMSNDSTLELKLSGLTRIDADVVSNEIHAVNNFIVLDKGESDGVKPEMGVIGGNGVVGIVYLCSNHYSLVMPLINSKSSLSCRVRGQEYFGYLQWDGKDVGKAYLDDIPRYAKIKKGMVIETSGYSAVFPQGLYVGKVIDVHNSSDGQSYRLGVDLGTNFALLQNVCIISTPHKNEIDSLRIRSIITEQD